MKIVRKYVLYLIIFIVNEVCANFSDCRYIQYLFTKACRRGRFWNKVSIQLNFFLTIQLNKFSFFVYITCRMC